MKLSWTIGSIMCYTILTVYFYFSIKKFCRYNSNKEKKYIRILEIIFLSLIPTFFAVYRYIDYPIGGTDAAWYIKSFENARRIELSGYSLFGDEDYLFNNIAYWIRCISQNYHVYFWIIYLFMIGSIYYFVKEIYGSSVCFAPLIYIIYFYLQTFNIIRFMMGVSFILFAFVAVSKERYIKALMYCLIAMLLHSTLIICFIPIIGYYFLKKYINKRYIVVLGCLAAYVIFVYLYPHLKSYFVVSTYRAYAGRGQNLVGQIMTCSCALFGFFFYKDLKKNKDFNQFMYFLTIFDVICIPVAMNFSFSRIHTVFLFPRLYMWGQIIIALMKRFPRYSKLIRQSSYIFAIIWTIFRFSRDWYSAGWMPYMLDIFR